MFRLITLSKYIQRVLTLALLVSSFCVLGQEELSVHPDTETFHKHRLTVLMANAFIPAADDIAGQSNFFIVPAWGLNYDYWISPKIGLGVHNSLLLQQFKIEKTQEQTIVERSFPVTVTGEVLVKPLKNVIVSIGAGREFESHESYTVVNTGLEYGVELQHGWELGLTLLYDYKIDAYDSWMLGVGFSKHLSRKLHQKQ